MAESTLTLGWVDLKKAVGHHLNFGSTPGNWTSAQTTEIELLVQTGYRRVLYPAHLPQVAGYEWSFLRPTTTLAIVADDGDYDLPDDFGRLIGEFHYAPDKHYASIRRISEAALLDMRSARDYNGHPNFAAFRFKSSDQSSGQRQEVLFYPEPDASYTLYYAYDAYTGVLSDSYPYPLGGMQMSEVYKEACLAAAEIRNGDEYGIHNQMFERLLLDAITRDRKRGAQMFGNMGQPVTSEEEATRRGRKLYGSRYDLTYKGSQV